MKAAKNHMTDLLSLYKKYFNLGDAIFTRIAHNDAIVAIVYKIIPAEQGPLILKISERAQDYFREVYFLENLVNKLPVPSIIGTFEPKDNIPGAILMKCLWGDVLKIDSLTEPVAYQIGLLLAQIHLNRAAGYGDLIPADNLKSKPHAYFMDKFEESFAECENKLSIDLLKQIYNYYEANIYLLNKVDGPCIIHRDFRPGNIIVNNGKLQGVIDWASGRASFAEEDFCPLELWEWSNNLIIKQAFLAGYSSIRPIPEYAIIMPLLKLNRIIATIGFTIKSGTWSSSNSSLYQINCGILKEFFGCEPD